jgi:glycosyltransferase involved in cell wall biosynthesis
MQWLLRGAAKTIESRPPNVLHCPTFVAPWSIKIPMVITVLDAGASRYPRDHPLEWRVYVRTLMPERIRAARRVITLSGFAKNEVVSVYGVDPDKVVSIPLGLDSQFLNYTAAPENQDSGVILFPGAPIGRKNLDVVLQCMAAANAGTALAKASLEISGAREADFPAYARQVAALGLQERVRWLGTLPYAQMPALYARASVVVYPSLYEGFGFPPLEAMAVGTPVVASDRGSLPEVLNDAALLVDPTNPAAVRDALDAVLTRPELRIELSRKGIEQARRYTWDKCADGTVQVYREVS